MCCFPIYSADAPSWLSVDLEVWSASPSQCGAFLKDYSGGMACANGLMSLRLRGHLDAEVPPSWPDSLSFDQGWDLQLATFDISEPGYWSIDHGWGRPAKSRVPFSLNGSVPSARTAFRYNKAGGCSLGLYHWLLVAVSKSVCAMKKAFLKEKKQYRLLTCQPTRRQT